MQIRDETKQSNRRWWQLPSVKEDERKAAIEKIQLELTVHRNLDRLEMPRGYTERFPPMDAARISDSVVLCWQSRRVATFGGIPF